jgi:hypothetical protein
MTVIIDSSSPIKETAQALGHLVMIYSGLERTLSRFLGIMLQLSYPAGDAVLGNIDARTTIKVIRAYGFARRPNDKWYDDLDETLKTIDNQLRDERNRMVHDLWVLADTGMIRVNPKPHFIQSQGKQPREMHRDQPTITVSDINALTVKVMQAEGEIMVLASQYQRAG